jgi:hypothetical protein
MSLSVMEKLWPAGLRVAHAAYWKQHWRRVLLVYLLFGTVCIGLFALPDALERMNLLHGQTAFLSPNAWSRDPAADSLGYCWLAIWIPLLYLPKTINNPPPLTISELSAPFRTHIWLMASVATAYALYFEGFWLSALLFLPYRYFHGPVVWLNEVSLGIEVALYILVPTAIAVSLLNPANRFSLRSAAILGAMSAVSAVKQYWGLEFYILPDNVTIPTLLFSSISGAVLVAVAGVLLASRLFRLPVLAICVGAFALASLLGPQLEPLIGIYPLWALSWLGFLFGFSGPASIIRSFYPM